jgi:uncharacterized protein (TIGR03066 family)
MKGLFAAFTLAIVFVGSTVAQEKDKKIDADKLTGIWELTKSSGGLPNGSIIEFTKDSKVKVSLDIDGKKIEIPGTFKVEKDKITFKISAPDGKDQEEVNTIKELTDAKLVLVDKDGKEDELTKKKK